MTTQKNISRKMATTFSLVLVTLLISTNLFAQKSFQSFDLKNITADLIKKSTEEIADAFFSNKETIVEEEINFEEWMIDLEAFSKSLDSAALENETVQEAFSAEEMEEMEMLNEEVELEEWMFELDWNYLNTDVLIEEDVEVKEWMTDLNKW